MAASASAMIIADGAGTETIDYNEIYAPNATLTAPNVGHHGIVADPMFVAPPTYSNASYHREPCSSNFRYRPCRPSIVGRTPTRMMTSTAWPGLSRAYGIWARSSTCRETHPRSAQRTMLGGVEFAVNAASGGHSMGWGSPDH